MDKEITQKVDLKQIKTLPFSDTEWNRIQQAKRLSRLIKPAFYHDAIVEKAESVISETEHPPNNPAS